MSKSNGTAAVTKRQAKRAARWEEIQNVAGDEINGATRLSIYDAMTPLNAHWIYDAMLLAIKATGGYSGYATLFMLDWKFTPRAFGSFPDFLGELISQLYREKQRGGFIALMGSFVTITAPRNMFGEFPREKLIKHAIENYHNKRKTREAKTEPQAA